MSPDHAKAVLDLVSKRISEEEFFRRYPVDMRRDKEHVTHLLEHAQGAKDGDEVEYALLLGFRFGLSRSAVPVLNRLLVEDWHQQHENIAMALSQLKDGSSVESLYRAALSHHPYLDYDEAFALAVKSIWGLGAIGTPEARAKLRDLAESPNAIVRDAARKQLARIGKADQPPADE